SSPHTQRRPDRISIGAHFGNPALYGRSGAAPSAGRPRYLGECSIAALGFAAFKAGRATVVRQAVARRDVVDAAGHRVWLTRRPIALRFAAAPSLPLPLSLAIAAAPVSEAGLTVA